MPFPLNWLLYRLTLRISFQSLSRVQCLCHANPNKKNDEEVLLLSIAQSRSMPLPPSFLEKEPITLGFFQSLSRAQCLCHLPLSHIIPLLISFQPPTPPHLLSPPLTPPPTPTLSSSLSPSH